MPRTVLVATLIVVAALTAVAGFVLLRREAPDGVPQRPATTDQALASFVGERFGTNYAGTCLRAFPQDGEIPQGMCSARFSRTARRALYGLGFPFSEWVGEATLVRDHSGSWRVASFEEYPPLGAGGVGGSEATSPGGSIAPGSPPQSWEGPPPPDQSGAVSITEFNDYQDSIAADWRDSPARIALEFLDLGDPSDADQGAFTTTLTQEANPEGGEQAEVTVTLDGLLDDSVQAIRYLLQFEKDADGAWKLVSATWSQRCAPGRGHRDFSVEDCI